MVDTEWAVATANDLLRAARERTASLAHPEECVSRQELAELVNAWIYKHHHKVVEISANYICKLEHGIIRWAGALYREALRAILSSPPIPHWDSSTPGARQ